MLTARSRFWTRRPAWCSLTLIGHTAEVTGIAFSPDGRRIATASFDQTIKLWDTATGSEVLTFRATAGLLVLAFSPDGRSDRFGQYRHHGPGLGRDSAPCRGPPAARIHVFRNARH